MAPYPGQARCLALGCWPECFRRLDVKGGRRPFPKETRSALDIEGKHVTIQGPSPEPGYTTAMHPPPPGVGVDQAAHPPPPWGPKCEKSQGADAAMASASSSVS